MSEQCVFCLDDMDDESLTVRLDGCHHIMHTSCFLEYVKHNLSNKKDCVLCPICRHIVIEIGALSAPQVIPPLTLPPIIVREPSTPQRQSRCRLFTPLFIITLASANLIYFLTAINT